ncbi:MAG: hypothetical protein LBD20_02235 [Spirochaetaceae bacterium]|jgi:hypothetical protein|nr:hypothetical protein [Spirochaetaceae bacterium]
MKNSTQTKKAWRFASLALIFALALSACQTETGPDTPPDTTDLEASITNAKNAKAGVAEASSAAGVPKGTKWVTTADMNAFNSAISTAETAKTTATTQAAVDAAKTTLDTAIDTFNGKKQDGTAAPVDKSALTAKIAAAKIARSGVVQAADAGTVAEGAKWVTAFVWNTFDAAITAAENALNSLTQAPIDAAVTTLSNAITTFNSEKQNGAKTTGFSAAELDALIADANAAKAEVVARDNGNDIRPDAFWVNQSALDTFNTAITNAQAANEGNRDSLYLALAAALTAFNGAKATGTVPDKTAMNNAITAADAAKLGVVEAASADDAPAGSKWATPAQFAPFTTAYTAATAALAATATKNAVDAATSGLTGATTAFNSAVTGNGLGTKPNTLTITRLPPADFPNETYLTVVLNQTGNFDSIFSGETQPQFSGTGRVSSGQVVVPLYNQSDAAWGGTGPWYAAFIRGDQQRVWVSKAAINFTANRCPTKPFTDFTPGAYFYRLGDMGMTSSVTSSMTLDTFFSEEGYGDYTSFRTAAQEEIADWRLYKDAAMTQEFSGSDVVNANTMIYCLYSLDGGGESHGTPIGQISGSITLTNVPAAGQRPTVKIKVFEQGQGGGNWHPNHHEISLSGISGASGTVDWTIPLYEEDAFDGSKTVAFLLEIKYGSSSSSSRYSINIDGTKQIAGTTAAVGSLGTASLAAVKLSGTINVKFNNATVPYVHIYPQPQTGQPGYGYMGIELRNPGQNAPWSLYLPAFSSPTTVTLSVAGSNTNQSQESLFAGRTGATVSDVQSTDISGIVIDLGNITQ